jgi:hypothetical protein
MMFSDVLLFELRYHLKSRLFLFGCAIFFLLAFLAVASPNVQIGALGGANYNSPFAILQIHVFIAMIGVLVGAAFLISAALRDTDERMAEIIYSTRIGKLDYVLARFIGAFIAAYLVYAASSFGFALATLMPWLDPGLIGPFTLWHYVYASVFIGLPALFANSVIVYAFAVLTRDQRIAYAVIIALLVAYQVAASMLGQMDYRVAAALVDPTVLPPLARSCSTGPCSSATPRWCRSKARCCSIAYCGLRSARCCWASRYGASTSFSARHGNARRRSKTAMRSQ